MANLRDAADLIGPRVAAALAALPLTDADDGAAALAARYAAEIDDSYGMHTLDTLGPKLLAVLESLGATPAARARIKDSKPSDARPGRLAQIRAASNT